MYVCTVISGLPVSELKWAEKVEATENDDELQRVVRRMIDKTVTFPKSYVTFIDELSIVDGIILKGQRVVIPKSMKT